MGQKKSLNLLGQKNNKTSEDKKIMQHLGTTKNYVTSWDKKNHATSWDKQNHATSQDKKKSCNLLGQKIMQLLWGKKSCNLSGQKKSRKWRQTTPNGFK